MPVIETRKDADALTLDVVAEFAATPDRVWQLWSDPRQLEQWWGPPGYPATVERHDLAPGGETRYYMTSPEGEKYYGWWTVDETAEPSRIVFRDGFSGDDGEPIDPEDYTTATVTIEQVADITRMTIHSQFLSSEQFEKQAAMGMEEGMRQAVGQIDAMLAA